MVFIQVKRLRLQRNCVPLNIKPNDKREPAIPHTHTYIRNQQNFLLHMGHKLLKKCLCIRDLKQKRFWCRMSWSQFKACHRLQTLITTLTRQNTITVINYMTTIAKFNFGENKHTYRWFQLIDNHLPLWCCCFLLPCVFERLLSNTGKVSQETNSLLSSCNKCSLSKLPAEALKDITQP